LTNDEKTNTDFSAFTSDTGCALAIARLAPQDYHRFHSPVEGTVLSIKDIQGEFSWLFLRRRISAKL
jgi:phosphatidylserine decarboxylase